MRPPQAVCRGVGIARGVCVGMVASVVGDPPKRPALRGRRADEGEHELQRPPGSKRAVRHAAVEERADRERPQQVRSQRHPQRGWTDADPKHRDAGEMQTDERCDAPPIPAVVPGVHGAVPV